MSVAVKAAVRNRHPAVTETAKIQPPSNYGCITEAKSFIELVPGHTYADSQQVIVVAETISVQAGAGPELPPEEARGRRAGDPLPV